MMTIKNTKELYEEYKDITQQAADVYYAMAVMGWDQEVYMPVKGSEHRGRQLSTLASIAHNLKTSEQYGSLLKVLSEREDLSEDEKANVQLSLEEYDKNSKLSPAFVSQLTTQTSKSYNAWMKARAENDFSLYSAELDRMISLKLQQAEMYGYEQHPYDSLMDEYEKGATVAMLDPIFAQVKESLPVLLDKIKNSAQVDDSFLLRQYDKNNQWDFSLEVLKAIGYDFEAGRQDLSEHPFTTSFSPLDVRVTTRVDEHDFASLLWSSIHEGGHALYEQGLPVNQYGMPLGEAASLSVHESQSRLWENCVGRGSQFWNHFYPLLQSRFSGQLSDITERQFYKSINKVVPSLVRTEADELTYHFHVMIRYDIEKALLSKEISSADVPAMWNELYQKYLGIRPANDKQGVLQDVHWAHGSFGYFPTYSLGSFYAAQYYAQAKNDIPGLDDNIAQGRFGELLQWLRKNIHVHGKKYRSEELCKKVTGKGLDINVFMQYVNEKYRDIYDITM